MHAQGNHHLVFPQGQGVGKRALDALHQQAVVVLQKADLGRHLKRHLAGELEIVQLLFKPVAIGGKIVGALGIHGVAAGKGLLLKLLQGGGADLLQLFFAGHDVHGQLLEILGVHVVEAVEHGHVLEQLNLMVFQRGSNGVDVGLHLVVLGGHIADGLFGIPEQAAQPLGLFGAFGKALDFAHQLYQHFAHLAGIAGAHGLQRAIRKIGNLFLRLGAVEQHMVGVVYVNLIHKGLDGLDFLFGKHAGVQLRNGLAGCLGGGMGAGFGCGAHLGGGLLQLCLVLRHGIGVQRQYGNLNALIVFGHGGVLLYLLRYCSSGFCACAWPLAA